MNWKEYLIELSMKDESQLSETDNMLFKLIGSMTIELVLWVLLILSVGSIKWIFTILCILNLIPMTSYAVKFKKLLYKD